MTNLLTPTAIPLSLYIHMPWCVRKCPYCDFNSHQIKQEMPEQKYIDTLLRDLIIDLPKISGRTIVSIFFGGGTPSLFSPNAIAKLLNEIQSYLTFAADIEITLEANPGTVDQARFSGFREAGVNRLSIGIQSFQAEKLKTLGRIHDDQGAIAAVHAAKAAGFDNFNLDLMHGLPLQNCVEACHDLQTAFGFMPPHLSWYQLTLEPNTLFYHRPPQLPDENILMEIQDQGHQLLIQNGFQHYEVSAYSQSGHACHHNINYWEFGDYLGIGAGAHSKITDFNRQTISRFWKIKHPQEYLNAQHSFLGDMQYIETTQLPFEFMLNALRLQKPIPITLFKERTGLEINAIAPILKNAQTKELLEWNDEYLLPTTLGRRFLNDLIALFMI